MACEFLHLVKLKEFCMWSERRRQYLNELCANGRVRMDENKLREKVLSLVFG
jgi:hypothetical protein